MISKLRSVESCVDQIHDGATVAVSGSGGGLMEPDYLLAAIEARFLTTGHPRNLTVVHALGIGKVGAQGMSRLAHEGLVKRIIGGHWTWSPKLQAMARDEMIEAYSLPAGVISTLLREIGAGRPGLITHIGLGTFADPRLGGGRCNARARDELVERVELDGRTYLRYKPFRVDVGIVRGSVADPRGNLSLRHEAADLDGYAVALAAHNSGGRVIAQVCERLEESIVPARLVRIPGILVDDVVLVPDQRQCAVSPYDPAISGEAPVGDPLGEPEMPEGLRRVIAARAVREFAPGLSINFGFGIPGGIPGLLAERGLGESYWGSVEQGIHNARLMDGVMFGAGRYPQAIVSSVDQFDFFSGGGIDVAFLGMGEMDGGGNVNVSQLGETLVGPGGFVDITQGARKIVFCGAFEAKGLSIALAEGRMRIESPGQVPKLVGAVRHVTFSGEQARARGQSVLYVTERAVFRMIPEGIELVEVAEGIDLQADVLERMGFAPILRNVRPMPIG